MYFYYRRKKTAASIVMPAIRGRYQYAHVTPDEDDAQAGESLLAGEAS